ncbi:hypothetical protein JTE90_018777 [Oedothorax gibbosus]|uniref:DUF6570 domain-containing protein n=1 Tax=Oedothorax gibbosus TaxID=931172 RepID=A0AAV6UVT9_9ARAC|nr:hypothetical protein JTE90_018777 [Oedothorax gibbosus]
MPPTCLVNELYIEPVPEEIISLNYHEKLLIQRAKALQTVIKMGTVSCKNKPRSFLNQKVVGKTFHLPLPLEKTLERLPKPEQAIITDQDLSSLKLLYDITRANKSINEIQEAICTSDVDSLQVFSKEYKKIGNSFVVHGVKYLNEDEISAKYHKGLMSLKRRITDTPSHICMSCHKLHYKRDVKDMRKLRIPLDGDMWKKVAKFVNDHGLPSEYICTYCLAYFRRQKMPPTCLVNELYIEPVPEEIISLNYHEKLLIQRAKAFQTVIKMGTVSCKNKPRSFLNQKVSGKDISTPIPLEKTLERLPKPEQAIITDQDLYVIVRGIPTNQKKLWQSLVNLSSVNKALKWLKQNNPLYTKIVLPISDHNLLDQLRDTES